MIKIIFNWGVAGRETTDCVTPPPLSCCLSVLWEKSFYSSTGTPPQRGIICTPMICHTALCVCACVWERTGAVTDTMSDSRTQPTGILANMRLLRPRRPTLHAHRHTLTICTIIMCLSPYLCLAFNDLLSFVFKEHCLIWTTPCLLFVMCSLNRQLLVGLLRQQSWLHVVVYCHHQPTVNNPLCIYEHYHWKYFSVFTYLKPKAFSVECYMMS